MNKKKTEKKVKKDIKKQVRIYLDNNLELIKKIYREEPAESNNELKTIVLQ